MRWLAKILILLACWSFPAQAATTLTVGAAASLQDVLKALAPAFQKSHPDIKLAFNFAASSLLVQQIEKGAPMDLFFSADSKTMDELAKGGFIDTTTRKDIVGNELVIVASRQKEAPFGLSDLAKPAFKRIALCDKAVPVGHYGHELLQKAGLSGNLDAKIVQPENARATLALVTSGAVDAGFIYATDAKIAADKITILYRAGPDKALDIRYPVAVLKRTKDPVSAKRLADFLASAEALAIFESFGFKSLQAAH